jgi:hypothetical protein
VSRWILAKPGGLYVAEEVDHRFVFDTEREALHVCAVLGLEGEVVPFPLPDEMPEGDSLLLVPRPAQDWDDN